MSSVVARNSRTLFPDIYNPQKQRRTSTFRKPLRQNICTGLLCAGFHRSFAQLFALLQRWEEAEAHPHKLETLQSFLARAETAERAGQYGEVYENHLCLARFFTESEDEWLKHHFFQLALQSARKLKIDSGKREAEANLHIGQIYFVKGQLELAQEHYEEFYHMTLGREWQDTSGRSHHECSCEELGRVYTLLAERLLQKQDCELSIKMLTKAYEMAKECMHSNTRSLGGSPMYKNASRKQDQVLVGKEFIECGSVALFFCCDVLVQTFYILNHSLTQGDSGPKGKAAYRLGLAYQSIGDHTTAKQFLGVYKDISTAREDMDNLGRAYGAIAKSLESSGKQTEAVQYLEKFAEISMSNKQDRNLEKAYTYLGSILNSRVQYDESYVYFKHAYEIACNMASVSRLQKAQVRVGTSHALSMLQAYYKHIEISRRHSIQKIIMWKEKRQDNFIEAIEQMKK